MPNHVHHSIKRRGVDLEISHTFPIELSTAGRTFHIRPAALLLDVFASNGLALKPSTNAAAESFWALLKEEIKIRTWPDRATARVEAFAFVETFCNRRLRKHKVVGYLTPSETRQRHQHALAACRSRVRDNGELQLQPRGVASSGPCLRVGDVLVVALAYR